jgi:hypothetical protein
VIARTALEKARAGDAALRARLERAEGLLDRIAAQHDKWGTNSSLYALRAILAERDAGEMSGYVDGGLGRRN